MEIDVNIPVFFYDDRNKCDVDYRLEKVLYQDGKLCLCKAVPIVRPDSELAEDIRKAQKKSGKNIDKWWDRRIEKEETILFDLESGEVLIKELDSWMATNDVTINDVYEDATEKPVLNA